MFHLQIISSVKDFIELLPIKDAAKIHAAFTMLENGEFAVLYIKTLRGPIKELIIKKYRFIFFIEKQTIFFIGAFIKKTTKTPKQQLEHAQRIYLMITS